MTQCPYCQNELKKGAVESDSRTSLRWVADDKSRSFISVMFDRDCIVLAKREVFSNSIKVGAYYCELCNKIIIDLQ